MGKTHHNTANFIIFGKNEYGNFNFVPDDYFGISIPKKTIITGKITEGQICKGDEINIKFEKSKILTEKIAEIQLKKQEIPIAVINEEIGISLSKTRLRTLHKMNNGKLIK